jgi:hypothetical protein
METLNFPEYPMKVMREGKKTKIFDPLRKKYLLLTPEEWVRQNLVQFLIRDLKFPQGLIAIEKGIQVNDLYKRADVVVYNKTGEPIFMVECKAPQVEIDQRTFDQIARYNIAFKLPYLMVSNGLKHYCAKIDFINRQFKFLDEIPSYQQL